MGIKQDRPVDYGDDGIVVYVAKSLDDVNKARAALQEEGVDILLPEAAVEALFAAGRESLPIRVHGLEFKKAQGIIDKVFPPPVIDLPPLPDEEEEEEQPGKAKKKKKAQIIGDGEEGGLDAYSPDLKATKGGQNPKKVAEAVNKTVFIALASLLLPVVGIVIAAFAAYSAWWCMDRLPETSSAREKAKIALGLSIGGVLWNIGFGLSIAWKLGLFG